MKFCGTCSTSRATSRKTVLRSGTDFLDAVEETFQDFERMPRMGTKREFQDARLSGVRMWRVKAFPKHLIFYRSIEDGVEIIRVLHSARDIESRFSDEDLEQRRRQS